MEFDFEEEYYDDVLATMLRLEKKHSLSVNLRLPGVEEDETHLSRHEITEVSRARMVDWMFECIKAFKMSDQTFFLSVQYLDRFINECPYKLKLD